MAPDQATIPKITRPDGLWLEDLSEGYTFRSSDYELTAEAIIAFAEPFDPQPYHLDEEAAVGTFFNQLVASGWHTSAITMRLLTEALPLATGLVGADAECRWPTAALPGDVLHLEGVVEKITPSRSRPGRASLVATYGVVNQDGEQRFETTLRMLVFARPR